MKKIQKISSEDLTKEKFSEFVKKNQPVVIKLPKQSIPCLSWDLSSLQKLIGSEEQTLYQVKKGKPSATRNDAIVTKKNFNDICKLMMDSCDFRYYQMITDITKNKKLKKNVGLPSKIFDNLSEKMLQVNLWLNRGYFESGLHYDTLDNLNLQIAGRKKFILYKPGFKNFYARSLFTAKGHVSHIFNPDDYDKKKFPNFESVNAERWEVVLEEGEILYLPHSWWHQVVSESEFNININYWWLNVYKNIQHPRQTLCQLITVLYRLATGTLY